MIRKLSQKDFYDIYSKVPRLCVEVVIKSRDGFLLTLRKIEPFKDKWHLPGGTVLAGESLDDATQRVAKEELGVDISVKKFLGFIEWGQSPHYPGGVISLEYLVQIKGQIKLDNQASEYGFFKKVPSNTIKEHKKFLEEWIDHLENFTRGC